MKTLHIPCISTAPLRKAINEACIINVIFYYLQLIRTQFNGPYPKLREAIQAPYTSCFTNAILSLYFCIASVTGGIVYTGTYGENGEFSV